MASGSAQCRISSRTKTCETNPLPEKALTPLVFLKALASCTDFANISTTGCRYITLRRSMQLTFSQIRIKIIFFFVQFWRHSRLLPYVDDLRILMWHDWRCRLLIAESYDVDAKLVAYYGNDSHKGIPPFNFKFITRIRNNSDADFIKNTLDSWLELLPRNVNTNWVVRT